MVMKTSLVCLLLVVYMGLFYFSNRHLPLKSTKVFSFFYCSTLILAVFDFITLYTLNHLDQVPDTLNLAAHLIYLMSINSMVYLYFLYLRSMLESKVAILSVFRSLQAIPFFITSVLILVLPIDYIEGKSTNYSLGPKAYALYVSVVLYNLMILYYCIRYWKLLNREKRTAILVSVPVFFVVSVVDILMPESLCIIVYVTVTLVGLMMSKENSEKYLDKQTGMFNQYALEVVGSEYIALKKPMFLVVMALSESDNAKDVMNWKQHTSAMNVIQQFCKKSLKRQSYRVCGNGFVFLVNSEHTAQQEVQELESFAAEQFLGDVVFSSEIMELSKYADADEMMSCVLELCNTAMNKMATHDFLTKVRNRNSYEEELKRFMNERVDAVYFLADLNNLKATNDSMGHSAGDELLQTFAKALKVSAGKEGRVFRYGGDEFVVLWTGGDAQEYLIRLEENCRRINQKREIPVDFAIGYGKILEEDGIQKADRMMYENKSKMKEGRK